MTKRSEVPGNSIIRSIFVGALIAAIVVCGNPTTLEGNQEAGSIRSQAGGPNKAAASQVPSGNPFKHPPPTKEEIERMLKSGFATTVRVDRVLVPAVVSDRNGRPILGLTQEDFQILEDQVPQKIDFFDVNQQEGISIAFLLDVSGSMRLLDKIGEAREAVRYFLEGFRKGDQAALLTFADGEVDTIAPFGTRPAVILSVLPMLKAYGQTALNDAIAASPGIVSREQAGHKAIVLITDGIDNASKLSLFEAMSLARRVDVPIYAIGFSSSTSATGVAQTPEEAGKGAGILKLIASETGGTFFLIDDPDDMKEAIRSIEEDLRTQYVIGYTPPRTKCDGSFRRIDLRVGKNQYRVRTRRGYVAGC
jgi:Ca-activated chloride channel family protein